jgi:4-amino-4-deoxy-L-arabinose transferase-like glycosyltransferase
MNLFMLTAAALLAWRLPSLVPPQTQHKRLPGTPELAGDGSEPAKPRSSIDRRVQAIFLLLIAAYVLMLSVLGGALLARYMIPVIPLVIVLAVAELRRALSLWWLWCGVCAAGFVVALLVTSPWRIAPEDNLTYASYVRLHQQAAAYLERHYAGERILTAWPASDELNRPFLGYVSSPLTVVRIDDFSGESVLRAAPQRQAFDVVFVFSTKYDPAANPMSRLGWWNRLQARYFDYHRDLSPALVASMLRGRIVWQRSQGAEWAAIIELDAIRNAKAKNPTLAKEAGVGHQSEI